MKLKKILALVCSVAMSASLFVSTAVVADAAVDGVTATLEFAGYETKGTATFAKINVKATIPETLVPYELIGADWETTFEDTYKGLMLQGLGFDIPNVAGLTYVGSLSSKADFVTLTDNKAAGKIQLSYAATGSYDTYYAGAVDTLATLYYRITGDVNAAYDVALSDAVIGLVTIDEITGSATPKEYTKNDFTITNATVKPADPEPEPQPTITTYTTTAVPSAELGADEILDDESVVATAYVTENEVALKSGDTVTWVAANGNGEKPATLANIDATTKLGLIVTGNASALGSITLKVVTQPAAN